MVINEEAEKKQAPTLEQAISTSSTLKIIMQTGGVMTLSRLVWGIAGFGINVMIANSATNSEEQQDYIAANAFIGTFARLTIAILAVWLTFYGNKLGALKKSLDTSEKQNQDALQSKISQVFRQSMLISCAMFIPPTLFLCFSGDLLTKLHEPKNPSELTQDYFRAYSLGLLPMLLSYNQENLALSMKKPWLAFLSCCIYTIVNVPLVYALVLSEKYSYYGLGLASSMSYLVGFLTTVLFHQFNEFRNYRIYKLSCDAIPSKQELKEFFKEGGKHAFQIGIDLSVNWIISILIGRKEKSNLVASQIAFQYYYLLLMPMANAVNAVSYAVSQQQDSLKNARKLRNVTLTFGFLIPLINLICSLIWPETYIRPFLNKENPSLSQTMIISKELLWLANATLCLYIPRLAIGAYIRGYNGETSEALKVSSFSNAATLVIGCSLFFATNIEAKSFFLVKLGAEILGTTWLLIKSNAISPKTSFFTLAHENSETSEDPLLEEQIPENNR